MCPKYNCFGREKRHGVLIGEMVKLLMPVELKLRDTVFSLANHVLFVVRINILKLLRFKLTQIKLR